jgi:hypothetical protein
MVRNPVPRREHGIKNNYGASKNKHRLSTSSLVGKAWMVHEPNVICRLKLSYCVRQGE